MPTRTYQWVWVAYLWMASSSAWAQDYLEDQAARRLIEETPRAVPIWLEEDDRSWLNLLTKAVGEDEAINEESSEHIAKEGVEQAHPPTLPTSAILLHGMGAHPDWVRIIKPLRMALADAGLRSLSMQMPLLSPYKSPMLYGHTLQEAKKRIASGIFWLRKQYPKDRIIIIGYRFGGLTALSYVSDTQLLPKSLLGVAVLDIRNYVFLRPRIDLYKLIANTHLPILDLFSEKDKSENPAVRRRVAARQNDKNLPYQQIAIKGDGPDLDRSEPVIAKHIIDWVNELRNE
ncbi:MAG: DUF3530 family protein [Candidatus Eutrophobiaceae bacterium]